MAHSPTNCRFDFAQNPKRSRTAAIVSSSVGQCLHVATALGGQIEVSARKAGWERGLVDQRPGRWAAL